MRELKLDLCDDPSRHAWMSTLNSTPIEPGNRVACGHTFGEMVGAGRGPISKTCNTRSLHMQVLAVPGTIARAVRPVFVGSCLSASSVDCVEPSSPVRHLSMRRLQ